MQKISKIKRNFSRYLLLKTSSATLNCLESADIEIIGFLFAALAEGIENFKVGGNKENKKFCLEIATNISSFFMSYRDEFHIYFKSRYLFSYRTCTGPYVIVAKF